MQVLPMVEIWTLLTNGDDACRGSHRICLTVKMANLDLVCILKSGMASREMSFAR